MKVMGYIDTYEKNKILVIYEKMLALKELSYSVEDYVDNKEEKNSLIKSIKLDFSNEEINYEKNWNELIKKYNWKIDSSENLILNFNDNTVLIKE
ncbi:CXXX repeat peptide modification system protein [Clostridium senegalense]|uniref:CXXX repeat peptide modification system protein n=1 Tax=Clostridium senegalense TaxID=1465809 RepID=A0A6M0H0W2_9CLOT|nr:CXXX repeat peptide modification system protein [Clostridium senegalense]NEU04147.1 CXXX repeat peptide modification system protein [Clostridium senegalense]